MYNPFDPMQGGAAAEALARQFGVSPTDAQRAFAALMPAFAMGLRRSAADPAGAAGLFGALMPGLMGAPSPFLPQPPGADLLATLFGSTEVSREVARQAAGLAGLSPEVLMRMLPVMGVLMTSAMMRQMADAQVGAVMSALGGARPPPPRGPAFDHGWGDLARSFFDGLAPQPEPPRKESSPPERPDAMGEAMRGWMAPFAAAPPAPQLATPPEVPPPAEASPPSSSAVAETPDPFQGWGALLDAGRDAQQQYLDNLRRLLDEPAPRAG